METKTYQVQRVYAQFMVPYRYTAPDGRAMTTKKRLIRTMRETVTLPVDFAQPYLADGTITEDVGSVIELPRASRSLFSAPRPENGQFDTIPDDVTPPTPTAGAPAIPEHGSKAEAEEDVVEEEAEELDLDASPIEEIAAWIKNDAPSIRELVEATEGDAGTAARLLEAEKIATGGSPRRGLVRQLSALIESDEDSGEGDEDEEE